MQTYYTIKLTWFNFRSYIICKFTTAQLWERDVHLFSFQRIIRTFAYEVCFDQRMTKVFRHHCRRKIDGSSAGFRVSKWFPYIIIPGSAVNSTISYASTFLSSDSCLAEDADETRRVYSSNTKQKVKFSVFRSFLQFFLWPETTFSENHLTNKVNKTQQNFSNGFSSIKQPETQRSNEDQK